MAELKQYRRKQDGHVVGPLTAGDAAKLAGFDEQEWEPVEAYQPTPTVDDEPKEKAPAKRKAPAKTTTVGSSTVKASEPAPVADAVDKGAGDGNEA